MTFIRLAKHQKPRALLHPIVLCEIYQLKCHLLLKLTLNGWPTHNLQSSVKQTPALNLYATFFKWVRLSYFKMSSKSAHIDHHTSMIASSILRASKMQNSDNNAWPHPAKVTILQPYLFFLYFCEEKNDFRLKVKARL